MKEVFVTVGTTSFDLLIETIDSTDFISVLRSRGFDSLKIQLGRGNYIPQNIDATEETSEDDAAAKKPTTKDGFTCTYYRFKPNLDQDMKAASLIISHAGAGSIMESLRLGKNLIVVINEQLMDNHQMELARAMADKKVLTCTFCKDLVQDLIKDPFQFEPYPPVDHTLFPQFLDREMFA